LTDWKICSSVNLCLPLSLKEKIKMKKLGIIILGFALVCPQMWINATPAQVQEVIENQNAAAVLQALKRLRTTATVLHVTAHPDDEDGALLAWLSRGQGVRTGLLTLNRGEGGANLIGPELFDALGIVRTEELLAAGRYYGVDQFFTRVVDFGFSKRLDETLEKWGRDTVLRDVVRVIRMYRPDIIISRFQGNQQDGHGNHQTAGVMSQEGFRAAAEANRFPEHKTEGLSAWQVKKLYTAPFSFRRGGQPPEGEPRMLRIDTGAYDPLLGRSYREIAREGLSHQRSQGAGSTRAAPGSAFSNLRLIASALSQTESETNLFDGLDTTIVGLAKLARPTLDLTADLSDIQDHVEFALAGFDARRPEAVMPFLTAGLRKTRAVIERVRESQIEAAAKDHLLFLLGNKEKEFVDAANKALGLSMHVLVDPPQSADENPFFQPRETFAVAIPGQEFTITATVVNRSRVRIEPVEIGLRTPAGWRTSKRREEMHALGYNEQARVQFQVNVPENAEVTRPYWSRRSEYHDDVYTINKPEYLNQPYAPPEVVGGFIYQVDGVLFALTKPAQTVYMDRPWGEQRRLLTVAPAVGIMASPRVGVIPVGAARPSYSVRVEVRNNVKGQAQGKVRLRLPAGWTATPAEAPFAFTHEGELHALTFNVSIPRVEPGKNYTIQAVAEYAGKEYTEGYEVIAHRDLEPRHLYRPATIELHGVDVKVAPGLKIGYVMGVGDKVPESLEQIGVKAQMLGEQDLASASLDQFDAIIIGIRAYAVRDDLKAYNRRLLDYVERGGNLIVQYQTQEFDAAPFGPYSYRLGPRAEEVSEENAAVTILEPTNPIFNQPNKLSPADFDGWVEERGSKFMSEWDERYKPLLVCNDRGQEPQRGGFVQAPYGRGTYTYAAYAFYRQLPAGVPGAYRLFANMISLNRVRRQRT
jgi:LmbE family N-acetylglucosaminyl deacetylase